MMLTKRDKAIIKDLNKFRVMDRDSIAELHFSNLKNPQYAANNVLLRLLRDGQIQRSTSYTPYLYFGPDTQIKKNSQKIGHFLAILNAYKEIRKHGHIETFLVEPKYGSKGIVEPDAYLNFRNTGFFIEVQKSIYSDKQMQDKIDRYVDLFNAGIMAKPFPHVLILSDQRYALDSGNMFQVFQSPSFSHFVRGLKKESASTNIEKMEGIKIKIG
ncbi:replication-relaxation family protein [Bacillus sp. FJAT-49705]|uniref:Replication-relaxation family protein n=1 Tax=Cytobacillus citreus TaxID=2833586 RepID=A0ABS5NLI1_9BACI|nr:replication-relaxation family protein [Cytobacillus citreus]MBS4188668.1 replication-relaxation family protein [Cytobacillus citreus]